VTIGRMLPSAPAAMPTLDELAADPVKAGYLPPEIRSRLLTRCAAVLTALSATPLTEEATRKEPAGGAVDAPEPERLLTAPEAANLMGFAPSYVYEMVRRGDLPAVRRKKYVRLRRSAVMRWITEHERWGVAASLSTVLSSAGDRQRSPAASSGTRPEANRTGRKTRRAPDQCEPMGTRHRQDAGTHRASVDAAGADRSDSEA
jgi:excisionase family DNA binding protein